LYSDFPKRIWGLITLLRAKKRCEGVDYFLSFRSFIASSLSRQECDGESLKIEKEVVWEGRGLFLTLKYEEVLNISNTKSYFVVGNENSKESWGKRANRNS